MSKNNLNFLEQNKIIQEAIVSSIQEQYPIISNKKTLRLKKIWLEDKLDSNDFPSQKTIKLKRGSWQVPAYANLELVDNATGEVIENLKKIKLANIPKLTNRFSLILGGNEYQPVNQWRLKSGVYTRRQANGELESRFNLEKGYNFRIILNDKGVFNLVLANKKYKLYNLLHSLDVSDDVIKESWGEDLFKVNIKGALNTEAQDIINIYKTLTRIDTDYPSALKGLKSYLDDTALSSETTKITLGESYDKVSPSTLLATSRRLLSVTRGDSIPDERDSLIFKELYSVDDLVTAYFDKNKDSILAGVKNRLETKHAIRDIISAATYSKPLINFFTVGDLSSTPTQTNPAKILSDWRKTTIMGTGGIQSHHAINLEARDIHPSHLGFVDPVATPEGQRIGVNVGLTVDAIKDGKDLKIPIILNSGSKVYRSVSQVYNMKLGMPDQMVRVNRKPVPKKSKVKGYYKGKPTILKAKEVEGYMEKGSGLFSYSTNLIPYIAHNSGNRMSMGSRMSDQAIALASPESPLIQTAYDNRGLTYQELIGNYLNPVAGDTNAGTVTKITDDYVTIKRNEDGKNIKVGLYNQFPLNQNSFIHSNPVVEVGDRVKDSTILADNNYNEDGALAIGRNVNVAYMSWKGLNFEDSVVATESFAQSFTSEKMVKKNLFTHTKRGILNKTRFMRLYPDIIDQENAKKLDDSGIIKVGQTVDLDDILVAYVESTDLSPEEKILAKMNKASIHPFIKKPLVWNDDHKGEVIYVNKVGRNIDIHIKVQSPLVEGDKIAGRYGNKGIISKIIPDHEAPHTKDGKRIDLILSPYGVPSRMNIGQLLETAAAKYADKVGKKISIDNFDEADQLDKTFKLLKKANIPVDELLTDGIEGKEFHNPIFWGKQYIMKLEHTVEKKSKARDIGSYDINMQPSRGGRSGQTIGAMETMAMLAHGSKENLYEMTTIKGHKNDEYWRAVQLGLPTPTPKTNFVFDKMLAYLNQSGVNVTKEGDTFTMMPLTDKMVKKNSSGEVKDPAAMLIAKNLAGRKGGIFDPEITGGNSGTKWSHIKLNVKIPSPIFEPAIQKLLNLTQKQYDNVLNEKEEIGGKTGFKAIESALKLIKPKSEIKELKKELLDANPQAVNKINRKIRYLEALVKFDMKPTDYMISVVPVVPPVYRPIYALPSGDLRVSPINKHYRDVGLINAAIKNVKEAKLDPSFNSKNHIDLYKSVKALQGLSEPIKYTAQKYDGALKMLTGDSPKTGFIHSKMWSKKQDLSARSTATLDPSLGIDEVGIPDEMAKVLFKPFVIQKMVKSGYKAMEALQHVKDWTPQADVMLNKVIEERPVLMNRAPSLHKHSIQAFRVNRHSGRSVRTNPLINAGFNLDYDGDTTGIHVPISGAAVDEAWNMLPSKNIFKHGDFSIVPELSKDYLHGLYFLTKDGKQTKKTFKTITEAKKDKALRMTDIFTINGKKHTLGRILVNQALPLGMRDYDRTLNKNTIKAILTEVAKSHSSSFATVINSFKDLGNKWSHERGSTISLNDLKVSRTKRNNLLNEAKAKTKTNPKKLVDNYMSALSKIDKDQEIKLKDTNGFKAMMESGGHKNPQQIRQILFTPGLMTNVHGNVVPYPIETGYAEGLDAFDYWNTMPGVRKGSVDKSINVSESGALNKSLLNVTRSMLITEEDCGTDKFIELSVSTDKKDIIDRVLARNVRGPGERGDVITAFIYNNMIAEKIEWVKVRTPLKCESSTGLCALCYGSLPGGQLPEVGYNVGIADGQAITERSTQLTMRSFHTGGAAGQGGGITSGFGRILQLVEVPETLSNKAVLASRGGKITNIESNALGGKDITIDDKVTLRIPTSRKVIVRMGSIVQRGDALTDGVLKPQELSELKTHFNAQQYMVDEFDKVYENSFHKKTFETVIRAISNNVEITDAPTDSQFLRGDRSTSQYVNFLNDERKKVGKDKIKYKEYFRSIKMLPGDSQDWLSRLGTTRLKQTVQDAAATGMSSSIHGNDPVPAYMYGLEFGKTKKREAHY